MMPRRAWPPFLWPPTWGRLACGVVLAVVCAGCAAQPEPSAPPLFERLPAERTGVAFENTLAESAAFNILNYLYYYNGGGVAIGDVNGDGRPDLYFTANEGPNRLYLNRGDFRFEDVTDAAGVAGTGDWTTGAVMADVNGDGRLDIYVTVVNHLDRQGRNQLFINNGAPGSSPGQAPTFTDRAADYGLDFEGYSTHAVFFDYDRDGDLDCYLLNHSVHNVHSFGDTTLRQRRDPRAGDRLYRNEGGQFVDVSAEAGIYGSATGYGLSAVASDVNLDGWMDLYVANDFHENDFLYINQGDGTFEEVIETATGHTSQFSMGSDAADINNDGWPDLVTLDMLPDRQHVLKTSASAEGYDVYRMKRRAGYHPQLSRNALQLNQGLRTPGAGTDSVVFSEIGLLAGIAATDWSWAALLADFDNDGWNDLFVANGIYRRPNDLDYINYASNEAVAANLERGITEENLTLLRRMPQLPMPNYALRNEGDLTFTDVSATWGLDDAGFSNGAAYADLDGDGDLDLVTNNINEAAGIYENHVDRRAGADFLHVRLRGEGGNTRGVGTKVILWHDGQMQMREQQPARGFQSSVEPVLHFGLGRAAADSLAADSPAIDSLTVVWPDAAFQTLTGVAADQTLTLDRAEAGGAFNYAALRTAGRRVPDAPPLFEDVTAQVEVDYRHEENTFIDFTHVPLIPHKLSTEGPALAAGDVNGDGLDDLYLGGAKGQPGQLMLQQPEGGFRPSQTELFAADSVAEDVDAVFFDADADGDLDLYVASGGGEFWGEAPALRDRLYLNDGTGRFRKAEGALPAHHVNTGVVAPGDYDGDGDVDLFVGGRSVSRRYGETPPSYLLENDGTGRFTDVTAEVAPALAEAGMITDATWADFDGDGAPGLLVAGEWTPLRLFRNAGERLVEATAEASLADTGGWWNALAVADFDGDGDLDFVAGNLGLNTRLRAAPETPARLHVADFNDDGRLDPLLTYYRHGASYLMATRDELIRQIPSFRQQFPTYADFGAAQLGDLFSEEQIAEAERHVAHTFASVYAENQGDGTFAVRPLPTRAQFAPLHALLPGDFDGDGTTDLLLAGNFYGVKPALGRYDASHGLLLTSDGEGAFEAIPPRVSKLWLEGQVRALAHVRRAAGAPLVVVARNDAPLQLVRPLRLAPSGELAAARSVSD